ncbi:hypothetical protein CVT26_005531 [Gymnopilus dilepis]|uniref:HMG box domain-containing protein n=1 Tax=Gymnopilus dilepis TaxID=231916 RepID=A0A409W7Z7_9AGAR|nr:hypothetical protein CVT26_005531 [Gymnopilus dilepis]
MARSKVEIEDIDEECQEVTAKEHIPRPSNPFILYRRDQIRKGGAKFLGKKQSELSKIIGPKWKAESEAVRKHYEEKSKLEKANHALRHPGYVYRPKKGKKNPKKKQISKASIVKQESADFTFVFSVDGAQQTTSGVQRAMAPAASSASSSPSGSSARSLSPLSVFDGLSNGSCVSLAASSSSSSSLSSPEAGLPLSLPSAPRAATPLDFQGYQNVDVKPQQLLHFNPLSQASWVPAIPKYHSNPAYVDAAPFSLPHNLNFSYTQQGYFPYDASLPDDYLGMEDAQAVHSGWQIPSSGDGSGEFSFGDYLNVI